MTLFLVGLPRSQTHSTAVATHSAETDLALMATAAVPVVVVVVNGLSSNSAGTA